MLSQALPNEIVQPFSYVPNRAKSAFVGSGSKSLAHLSKHRYNRDQDEDLNSSYMRPFQRKQISTNDADLADDEYKFERPVSPTNEEEEKIKEERELSDRRLKDRIRQLERTNLSLRRMLELSQSYSESPNRFNVLPRHTSATLSRSLLEAPLGPPTLRQGRVGSSWRHIKQTNNYSNANLLFIDGTVRINDATRFPPSQYGYPPKLGRSNTDLLIDDYDRERDLTVNGYSLNGPPQLTSSSFLPTTYIRRRPMNLTAYSNQFNEKARQGYEYWVKDRKLGENTKTKASEISQILEIYRKSGNKSNLVQLE